jgi:hypothetical protein
MDFLGLLAMARLTENSDWATPELAETAWVFPPRFIVRKSRGNGSPKHQTKEGLGVCSKRSLSCPWRQPARLKREGMWCVCSVGQATPPAGQATPPAGQATPPAGQATPPVLSYSVTASIPLLCTPNPILFQGLKDFRTQEMRHDTEKTNLNNLVKTSSLRAPRYTKPASCWLPGIQSTTGHRDSDVRCCLNGWLAPLPSWPSPLDVCIFAVTFEGIILIPVVTDVLLFVTIHLLSSVLGAQEIETPSHSECRLECVEKLRHSYKWSRVCTGIWWEALWLFNWKESRIVGRRSLSSQASQSEGNGVSVSRSP